PDSYAGPRRTCRAPSVRDGRTTSTPRTRGAPARAPRGPPSRSLDGDAFDHDVLPRPVARIGLERGDRVDDVHAVGDASEDRVLAVEPRGRWGRDDEELAAVRVRAGVRHRECAAHDLVVVELVLELIAGAAGAGARRVAALDHEVRDDAVEDDTVVEAVARELDEVVDGLRRVV